MAKDRRVLYTLAVEADPNAKKIFDEWARSFEGAKRAADEFARSARSAYQAGGSGPGRGRAGGGRSTPGVSSFDAGMAAGSVAALRAEKAEREQNLRAGLRAVEQQRRAEEAAARARLADLAKERMELQRLTAERVRAAVEASRGARAGYGRGGSPWGGGAMWNQQMFAPEGRGYSAQNWHGISGDMERAELSQRRFLDGTVKVGQGVMQIGHSLAYVGALSEANTEKMLRQLVAIEATVGLLRGVGTLGRGAGALLGIGAGIGGAALAGPALVGGAAAVGAATVTYGLYKNTFGDRQPFGHRYAPTPNARLESLQRFQAAQEEAERRASLADRVDAYVGMANRLRAGRGLSGSGREAAEIQAEIARYEGHRRSAYRSQQYDYRAEVEQYGEVGARARQNSILTESTATEVRSTEALYRLNQDMRRVHEESARVRIDAINREMEGTRQLLKMEQDRLATRAERFDRMAPGEKYEAIQAAKQFAADPFKTTKKQRDILRGLDFGELLRPATLASANASGFGEIERILGAANSRTGSTIEQLTAKLAAQKTNSESVEAEVKKLLDVVDKRIIEAATAAGVAAMAAEAQRRDSQRIAGDVAAQVKAATDGM